MKFQANDGRSNDPNMDVLKKMTLKVICWKKNKLGWSQGFEPWLWHFIFKNIISEAVVRTLQGIRTLEFAPTWEAN